jgi:hypothetical protein
MITNASEEHNAFIFTVEVSVFSKLVLLLTDFIVVRYSATNSGLLYNTQFCSQVSVVRVNSTCEKILQCLCTNLFRKVEPDMLG